MPFFYEEKTGHKNEPVSAFKTSAEPGIYPGILCDMITGE